MKVVYESLDLFIKWKKEFSKIVRIDGKDKKEIKQFGDKKIFTDVTRIKIDKTKSAYVIDASTFGGRVLSIDPDGITKLT